MKNKSKKELQKTINKQNKQKHFKKQKAQDAGITLIALVVTIIILLILAGVSLSAISNQGIISKAKEVTDIYSNAQKEEEKVFGEIEETIINEGETYELTINKNNAYLIGYEKTP